jgi:hypothetical protein
MTKGKVLETLAAYFATKGKFMNMREYKQQSDFPISPNLVIRCFGSWGRIPGKIRKFYPELAEKMNGVEAVASEPTPEPVQPAKSTRAKAAETVNE